MNSQLKKRPCVKHFGIAEDHGDRGLTSQHVRYLKNFDYIYRTNLNQTTTDGSFSLL